LRRFGSGNLGAANVMRSTGVTPGVLVAALDIGKGVASVILAAHLTGAPVAPAAAGLAAIVGHVYPVWLGFRGGKGVATACGVFAVLAPVAALTALGIFVASVWLTKYVSVGSVLASMTLPLIAYSTGRSMPIVAVSAVAAGLIVFRHRSNLSRVFAGTERRLGRARQADLLRHERPHELPESPLGGGR
jgi:glycerol-3-phosphate acyltransferase PlsY